MTVELVTGHQNNKRDEDVEYAAFQLRTVENQKAFVARVLQERARRIVEPIKDKLPKLLFAGDTARVYSAVTFIVVYDVARKNLLQIYGNFGDDEPYFGYDDRHQPSKIDLWISHGLQTIIALKKAQRTIERGRKVVPPKHAIINANLIPNELPKPKSRQMSEGVTWGAGLVESVGL